VLQGLDANISVNIVPRLAAEARLSLLRGYRLAQRAGETGTWHDWLPLMPADRYQYGIRWTFAGARQAGEEKAAESFVRLIATSVARQHRIPEEGLTKAAPPAYTTLGFEAAHVFRLEGQLLEVGLNVQNLSNTRYREYLDFFRYYADMPGVNVGVRAKLTFGG